jgi:hypothetical protein
LVRRWTDESVSTLEARLSVAMSLPTPRWDERSGLRPAVRAPRRAPVALAITALALIAGAGLGWHVARPSTATSAVGTSVTAPAPVTAPITALGESDDEVTADPLLADDEVAANALVEAVTVPVEGVDERAGAAVVDARTAAPNAAADAPVEMTPEADVEPTSRRRRRRPPRAVAPEDPSPPEPTRPSLLLDVDAFDAQRRR